MPTNSRTSPPLVTCFLAFHRSVASWAEAGFDVIVDGSLPYEDRQLRDACIGEAGRPEERPTGWAVRQARDIHEGMHYSAEVDTTARSAEECAEDVATQLQLAMVVRR